MGTFSVGNKTFKTKTEALSFFKAHVNEFPFNQDFESEQLSTLILEHHYYCKENKLSPVKFKKFKGFGDSYFFNAYFVCYGWKQISWRTCIEGHSLEKQIKNAARDLIKPQTESYFIFNGILTSLKQVSEEQITLEQGAMMICILTEIVDEVLKEIGTV